MDVEHPRPAKKRYLAAEERQRAVRACDECRRLKEKCEDGSPCRRCRHLRRACEFKASPTVADKRGSGFADSLYELRERLRCMESILKHHFPDLSLDIDSLRRSCDSLPLLLPSRPLQPDTEEQVTEALPNSPGIEDEDCTVDYVDGTTTHYSGEFSYWNFSMHVKRNIDELMAKSDVQSSENANRIPDFIRVGEANPESTAILDIVAMLPPRPVAIFLANVFFKHAVNVYYYVDQHWVSGMVNEMYKIPTRLQSKDVTAACAVVMVLAVGTQYAHLESPKRYSSIGAGVTASSNLQSDLEIDIGSIFYSQVAKLLSEVIHSGSLLSVQVFLLLGLYSLPVDASGLGYIYLNMAVKLAIQNGMHRKSSHGAFDSNTKNLRRRIWWTAYCLERLFLRKCPRSEIKMSLDRIKKLKMQMSERWSIPRCNATSTSTTLPIVRTRAEIHSRLEYCLLEMFIGRPFLLSHRQEKARFQLKAASAVSAPSGMPRTEEAASRMQWEFLIEDCVTAAKEAIDICHKMQKGRLGLARSSYVEYSSCRASLLVLIAYSISYRTNQFSSILQSGLEAIREMAPGDSARSEVSLLETLEAALHRLHVFDLMPNQSVTTEAKRSAQEGYEGFLNWWKEMRTSSKSRNESTASNDEGAEGVTEQNRESCTRAVPMRNDAPMANLRNDFNIDDYHCDLDSLYMDRNLAFFSLDFGDHGCPEKDLFGSLL
ncbi:hypothetical protein K431DRAFT_279470 [Polychaeton citri CBS 116435]|uniref:Zn(2)-C6 fungal-type domain-containing protein n=1 Tax=Polychaeton citri CBS 116435 TaxID=1314669 RepID=A0A9P4UJA8_9PEZI|nr:hypothetical protein K431DRAFT_279470 [Polychaeton citri CBS 116435]